MSQFARQRKKRLRDFESRAAIGGDVRTHRDWRYLTVYPFGDEPQILKRLSIQPSDCTSADVWWHTGKDIVLLQTIAANVTPGLFTFRWFGNPPQMSIVATFCQQVTTIENLHVVMDLVSMRGLPKRCGNRGLVTLFELDHFPGPA